MSTRIRIGRIPYLNCEPFYYGLNDDALELSSLVPRELSRAAERGEVDAGPVPVVDCFRLEDRFERLGGFCIATGPEAFSVLLFSRRPITELDGAIIAVTQETSTSARLLKVLLACRYQVQPKGYAELDDTHDALLVIGDEALRRRKTANDYPYLYDLGREWYQWKGLPFVFALWVIRRDLDGEAKETVRALLARCLDDNLAHLDAIAQTRTDLNLTPPEVVTYLRSFRYVLSDPEEKALAEFRTLLQRIA